MRSKSKVTIIITCQIVLIFGSFLTLAIFESQTSLLGNAINVAGKNRFLASQFINEVKDYAYLKNPEANPENKLIELEENIYLLKNGGTLNENRIPQIEIIFEQDWLTVQENFLGLKTEYFTFIGRENLNLTYQDMTRLEHEFSLFIQSSDNLVEEMGNRVKILADRLVFLQIVFLFVNISVHLGLIFLIITIYQNEFKKGQKITKLATIGELAARLSHDMRTPLSNINMSLKLIEPKITEKESRKKLEIAEKSVDKLCQQINNVLDYVRTKEPTIKRWKLNSILKESLNQIEIPETVQITLPKEDIPISCDKEQFEILFLNLIKNSLESIKETGFIKIYSIKTLKEVIIKIEDSGPGIPEEYLPQIFEPLMTLKDRGTGLGLASCQNIVNNHKGTITVKNKPTTFTIILPEAIQKE